MCWPHVQGPAEKQCLGECHLLWVCHHAKAGAFCDERDSGEEDDGGDGADDNGPNNSSHHCGSI